MALFDLVQDYEDADQEKRRTFKDFAHADISAVFFNGDEHAGEHNVDGKDVLVILEAMKMEIEVTAPVDGTVKSVAAAVGTAVNTDDLLVTLG